MMSFTTISSTITVGFSQLYITQSVHIDPSRVRRGIFGTVTTTAYQITEKKVYVPTVCVDLDPSMPNCRNVRSLFPNQNWFGFVNIGNELNSTSRTTAKHNVQASRREDVEQTKTVHVQGWGEYLGLYQPTVTVTQNITQTKTVRDPTIVVTYSITGCKPQNLPENLERCPENDPLELAEILPTSTVLGKIEATKIPENVGLEVGSALESAEIDKVPELVENNRPTKSL